MIHTPTPWVIDGHSMASIIRLQFPVGHPDCKHITGTYESIARCDGENWRANAAFIVKACNHHDDLVHIVEQFVNGAFTNAITSEQSEIFECLLAKAHHTLSKVRGEA